MMALQSHHGGPGQVSLHPFLETKSLSSALPLYTRPTHVLDAFDTQHTKDTAPPSTEAGRPENVFTSVDAATATQVSFSACNHSLVDDQMKAVKTKATIGILSTLITYVSLSSWYRTTYPNSFNFFGEDKEEATWLASSKSWFDRKTCRWTGLCGGAHMYLEWGLFGHHVHHKSHETPEGIGSGWHIPNPLLNTTKNSHKGKNDTVLEKIPDFVFEYAPLVHLFSREQFWPCDIAEHLYHITPNLNYTPIQSEFQHPHLKDLDALNQWNPSWVYLKSNDDVEERPEWLEGAKNIPSIPKTSDNSLLNNDDLIRRPGRTYLQGPADSADDSHDWPGADDLGHVDESVFEKSNDPTEAHQKHMQEAERYLESELKRHHTGGVQTNIRGGRSDAPAVLIAVDKGDGVVDAFWFFFYSFNLGNTVFNIRFGNHVGDWEHTAIRFQDGKPQAVFFSEHNFGSAYSYEAVEKIGKRPVIYSATGTHAMYATSGLHPYVLPWGILHDETDKGPLWDPMLNSHMYTYDHKKDILRSSTVTPKAPTGWFYFAGHWGDKFYPLGDKRQYRFAGQYHYVSGPLGPRFKNLGRKKICGGPDTAPCVIKNWLGGSGRVKRWQSNGEEADAFSAAAKHRGFASDGVC